MEEDLHHSVINSEMTEEYQYAAFALGDLSFYAQYLANP